MACLDIVGGREIEGLVPADVDIRAGRADQRLSLRQYEFVMLYEGLHWRRNLWRKTLALIGSEHREVLQKRASGPSPVSAARVRSR